MDNVQRLLNEKNIAVMEILGGEPKMSKNETLYKEVKCKVQYRLHFMQDTFLSYNSFRNY